jgi:GntR family transcriptional regulator
MDQLNIQLSAASGVPFYRQIVDQVAGMVRSGQLSPGQKIPSVRVLAAQLMVSLITIRRAYADLEGAGLILRKQGYGTYVAERVKRAARERSLKQARDLLKEAVLRAGQLGLKDKEIVDLVERQLR